MNNTGDTVATVMGWLSSTQAGGATTFHNGVDLVRLWPTRGAAGVWYSLYTDGSMVGQVLPKICTLNISYILKDNAVYHGGCPVLAGHKWIVNKWVMSFDQWNRIPCDLTRRKRVPVWGPAALW